MYVLVRGIKRQYSKKVVGLILREINLKSLSKEDYVNGRVLLVEVELRKNETGTLIIACVLTEDATNEEKECFYETWQDTADSGGDNTVIMGDLNG